MKLFKEMFTVLAGLVFATSAYSACNFKNTSNYMIFEATAMSVISGSTEVEFQCDPNYPFKLFPYTDTINILDNNEMLEITYWLDSGFTERLSRSNPYFGIGNGKFEKQRIYIKVTGKGPALNPKGNIVVNKHNLKLKHNLVIE